ncbi:MAG TPA: DUF5681 domain-containing protein [Xanthobacteraceae bacterium]|nr:DUF5681 domain-containing protein [Xanthobacteraceae bacterium]
MRFQKGQSGNPAGRPPGMRSAAALLTEELLEGEAENLARAMIEKAKTGDTAALRLCLDRIAPARRERERAATFDLAQLKTAADAASAIQAITAAVADGDLSPAAATDLFKYVEAFRRTLQVVDFEERIIRLEQRRAARDGTVPAGTNETTAGRADTDQIGTDQSGAAP